MMKQRKIWIYSVIAWAIFMVVVILISIKGKQTAEEPPVVETPTITPQVIEVIVEEPVEEVPTYEINRSDVEMLARLAWGEARGCTTTEQAAVMWCVLNRVDSDNSDFKDTIAEVITQSHQFYYNESFPLEDELVMLAEDVLYRWYKEKDIGEIDGRVLPQGYCWFLGDGKRNHFSNDWRGGDIWDWSWESPYEE